MSIFNKKPAGPQNNVDAAISALQKQADDLFDMEDYLHDEIEAQRSIIQTAQNIITKHQAQIEKSGKIRASLTSAIQATTD